MPDPTPPAGRDDLRDRIAERIRDAAHDCESEDCPCDSLTTIYVTASTFEQVSDVEGPIVALAAVAADAVRPDLDRLNVAYNGAEDECKSLLAERRTWWERAEQAEVAVERARELAENLRTGAAPTRVVNPGMADLIDAALNGPIEDTFEASPPLSGLAALEPPAKEET